MSVLFSVMNGSVLYVNVSLHNDHSIALGYVNKPKISRF